MSVIGHREDVIGVDEALTLHEGFVRMQAMRWKQMLPQLDLDDLLQEGRLALALAQRTFDPRRGVVFLTYAGRAVHVRIRNYVHKTAHLIRVPRYRLFEAPGVESLDVMAFDDSDETRHAMLADPAEAGWEQDDRHVRMMAAMQGLHAHERHVLMECLGRGRAQREVAGEIGRSHTRVQQLVVSGLMKIRKAMRVAASGDEATDAAQRVPTNEGGIEA